MNQLDQEIQRINIKLSKSFTYFSKSDDKGYFAQNIVGDLRHLVEHIAVKIYSEEKKSSIQAFDYNYTKDAMLHVKSINRYKFIEEFHKKKAQLMISHYIQTEEASERMILSYLETLVSLRNLMSINYGIAILEVLDTIEFIDDNLENYYANIFDVFENDFDNFTEAHSNRYYIERVKPLFYQGSLYYEVTFINATENTSKFERTIAFTKYKLMTNYSLTLHVSTKTVQVNTSKMDVQFITDWNVSIRPCEIQNLGKLLDYEIEVQTSYKEYKNLMDYMKFTNSTLLDIITSNQDRYYDFHESLTKNVKKPTINRLLDSMREIIIEKRNGHNVIRYLIYNLRNLIIKKQTGSSISRYFSNTYIDNKCIPFDKMPLASALKNHNPKFSNVFESVVIEDREHELLAREVKLKTERDGEIYIDKDSLISEYKLPIDTLITHYNNKLYHGHPTRRLESFSSKIFIKQYESDLEDIIKLISYFTDRNVQHYTESIKSWLKSDNINIDCETKINILENIFAHSRVAFIYGAAGTGKSTLIDYISEYWTDSSKLILANTNPAVENLRRKVRNNNCEIKTISKFLSNQHTDNKCDLLILDECSTISNSDIKKILEKADSQLILFVGDTFQIESIIFGNWFSIAPNFFNKNLSYELRKTYRTDNANLLTLWEKARNIEINLSDYILRNNFSSNIEDLLSDNKHEDEIILSLNYNGFYGINNLNKILQQANPHKLYKIGLHGFKINDPIIFNDSNRFSPAIHNNLKGKIIDIVDEGFELYFKVEIDKSINEIQAINSDLELLKIQKNNSLVAFRVGKYLNSDTDVNDINAILPFQIAYAISIHKAQGLEFDNIKIVITKEAGENISHNIFYTAITRAKKSLKIYWSKETEHKVINSFKKRNNKRSINIMKKRILL